MKLILNSNFRVQGMLFSTIVLYYNCITPTSEIMCMHFILSSHHFSSHICNLICHKKAIWFSKDEGEVTNIQTMSMRVHFLDVLLELVWLDERYLGPIAAPPPMTLIVKFATQWGKFHNDGVWLFRLTFQEGEPGFVYKLSMKAFNCYLQTWNLSNILHDQIFGPKILHTKNA